MNTLYSKLYIMILMVVMLLSGCVRDQLPDSPDKPEGKKVTVSLTFNVPAPETHKMTGTRATDSDKSFSVSLDSSQPNALTRSDGKTKLYNLWIFQFNSSDGYSNGKPYKISDEITAVNDMVTLEVPLTVSTNQTLYLVALGPKLEADFTGITNKSDLEQMEFEYTVSQGGLIKSKIHADEEIPLAGTVDGVTVLDVDGGTRGLVEYNSPEGFSGNIPIKRLMAKIALKYKFEVSNYKLEGFKLINAAKSLKIINPVKNEDTVSRSYVTLDPELSEVDAEGYATATWYVAQNCKGEVPGITSETNRYYKTETNSSGIEEVFGTAPPLGSFIEAWAYMTTNSESYAIYQIYVGKNNTTNFDVQTNSVYNLRTAINTDIASSNNDGRIRAYSASHRVYLASTRAYNHESGDAAYSRSYNFDAHPDWRPLTIDTKGTEVTIGVYTDEQCVNLADPATSWLRISSSPTYTEAYNNKREPLTTKITTATFLPVRLRFYLYSNEYLPGVGDVIPSNFTEETVRTLYVVVKTTKKNAVGDEVIVKYKKYKMDQAMGAYVGALGGEMVDGSYTKALFADMRLESKYVYDVNTKASNSINWGYSGIVFPAESPVRNVYNGMGATHYLAENTDNLVINTGLPNLATPKRLANGKIDTYQYSYYNTFAARFCYDRNRDEDGNGTIDYRPGADNNEMKWYLPSLKQGMGLSAFYFFPNDDNKSLISDAGACATTTPGYTSMGVYFNRYMSVIGLTSGIVSNNTGDRQGNVDVRCVREVPYSELSIKGANAPAAYVYTDAKGHKYAGVNSSGHILRVENRADNPNFYVDAPLYYYNKTGENAQPVMVDGVQVIQKRIRRHDYSKAVNGIPAINHKISSNFIVSPTDVTDIIYDRKGFVDWAEAAGLLATANSNTPDMAPLAADRGCHYYQGKDPSNPDPPGSWREPLQREAVLIMMMEGAFLKTASETGYELLSGAYWISTENSGYYPNAWRMEHSEANTFRDGWALTYIGTNKSTIHKLRCIKDLPPSP